MFDVRKGREGAQRAGGPSTVPTRCPGAPSSWQRPSVLRWVAPGPRTKPPGKKEQL